MTKKTYTGTITRKTVNAGSKSEHEAVVLQTATETLQLRVKGNNPFIDPALLPFIGTRATITGEEYKGHLIVDSLSDIKPELVRNPRPPKP